MKIAISGGMGFIGSWLIGALNNQHECVVLTRGNSFVNNQINFNSLNTDYSIESLIKVLDGFDAVIHLAAKKADLNSSFPEYVNENIMITSNIFEACYFLNIKNVVNISSRMVYDLNAKKPWTEESPTNPLTFYGISKLTIDKLVYYYNENFDMKIKSLRLSQVMGLKKGLSTITEEQLGYMPMSFIASSLVGKTIVIYGDGKGKRDYIYIKDVIKAIKCAIEKPHTSGIFNIASGKSISHKNLAKTISNIFSNGNNILFDKLIQGDENIYRISIQKSKEQLNFTPNWSLEEALWDMKETIENDFK